MCVSVQEAGEEVQGAHQDGQHQEQLHHRLPLHPCLHLVRHPQVWWVLPTSLLAALAAMVRHYVNRFAKKCTQSASSSLINVFWHFYWTQVYLGSDLWVRVSLTHRLVETSYTSFWNFIQVIDSIQLIQVTEKVTVSSGAIWWPNLELMQVTQPGGKICN